MLSQKAKIQILETKVAKLEQSITYLLENLGLDGVSTWAETMANDEKLREERKQALTAYLEMEMPKDGSPMPTPPKLRF